MSALPKKERLFEQRLISLLFGKGKRLTVGDRDCSLRICYIVVPQDSVLENGSDLSSDIHCKVLVNAPKSRFKRAVDRNRIKRLLRESFRFHKDLFVGSVAGNAVLLLSLQFVGNKDVSLSQMSQQVEKVGKSLRSRLGCK